MSVEIPFKILAGTELLTSAVSGGGYLIFNNDAEARILPINQQNDPNLLAIQYVKTDPVTNQQNLEPGFLPFPEKLRSDLMEILSKMELLEKNKKSTPSVRSRHEILEDVQASIMRLEAKLPKTENQTNPVIFGLKAGFKVFSEDPEFQVF